MGAVQHAGLMVGAAKRLSCSCGRQEARGEGVASWGRAQVVASEAEQVKMVKIADGASLMLDHAPETAPPCSCHSWLLRCAAADEGPSSVCTMITTGVQGSNAVTWPSSGRGGGVVGCGVAVLKT